MDSQEGARFERELAVARRAATRAGEIIAAFSEGGAKSWEKAEDSPVTEADLAANRAILDELRAACPDDAILSEETADSPSRQTASRLWVVDPLDGTKEFIAQIPEFAVSIALVVEGEPVVGVVYQPLTRECFFGGVGMGVHCNDLPVEMSKETELAKSEMLSSRTEMKRGQVDGYKDAFRAIRPVGSVALKLALVAAGRGDVWLSMAPKSEWDVCGGHALVREAGGRFVTFGSGERSYNQRDVLLAPPMAAGPPALVDALLALGEQR